MRVAILLVISVGLLGLSVGAQKASEAGGGNTPKYTADGKMVFPANYRE